MVLELVDSLPVNSDPRCCAGAFVWYIGEIFLCKDKLLIEDVSSGFGVTLEEAVLVFQRCHTCEFLPFTHYKRPENLGVFSAVNANCFLKV